MVQLLEVPCPPVHHTAETLRSWAIWRKARPWWKAKSVAAKCFVAAGALGAAGGLAAPLIPPLFPPSPLVIIAPRMAYGGGAPGSASDELGGPPGEGGTPFNPGPVIGFVPLVPIGGGYDDSFRGGDFPGFDFPGGGPQFRPRYPLVPGDLLPGPGDTGMLPRPPQDLVPPSSETPPIGTAPPPNLVTPPGLDMPPAEVPAPEPSTLALLGTGLLLLAVPRRSVVASLLGWLGRWFGRGRLSRGG